MKSLVAITRNEPFTCECGLHAEKIGFIVSLEDGNTSHYGSECIKKVLGDDFNVKAYELKKGWHSIKLTPKKLCFGKGDNIEGGWGYCVLNIVDGKAKRIDFNQVIYVNGGVVLNPDYNIIDNTYNYCFKGSKAMLGELLELNK